MRSTRGSCGSGYPARRGQRPFEGLPVEPELAYELAVHLDHGNPLQIGGVERVLAVPSEAAQDVADRLVEAGVKIIFNYTERLLSVPPEVTVHTSSPAVDLLYALYFYLT